METESQRRQRNSRWRILGNKKRASNCKEDAYIAGYYDESARDLSVLSETAPVPPKESTDRSTFKTRPIATDNDNVADQSLPPDDPRMLAVIEKTSRLASFRRKRATSASSSDGSEFTDKGTTEGIRVSILKRIPMSGILRKSSGTIASNGKKASVSLPGSQHRSDCGLNDNDGLCGASDHVSGGGIEGRRSWRRGRGRGGIRNSSDDVMLARDMVPTSGVSFDFSAMQGTTLSRQSSARGGFSSDEDCYGPAMGSRSRKGGDRGIEGDSYHVPRERARYSIHHGKRGGKKRLRVRPYHCFPEPKYLTEEDIYEDSLKPTERYEFMKSYLKPSLQLSLEREVPKAITDVWGSPADDGRIGAFRVEVLGCISLGRTKPDVSVYCVCGDAVFSTDVLTGYRSPMWPSASKRAAVFPVHHAYAKVFVGVFDVRARKNNDNDVFCGRVALDISSIRPDTDYDVTFPLRASSFVYDRKPRGVIRLRFALHWFNERAAVFSYFKGPKSLAKGCPLVHGQPTIPCADPKTFRNLAITVYGHDLPGKYTRGAFRATMREFNLYQQNLRQMVKTLILDVILYRKPLVSLYIFFAGIHCVLSSSIRMVPPYFVGYLLILLIKNHQHFVQQQGYNLGYKPLTLLEIAKGCLFHYRPETPSFNQIFLQKRTKQRRGPKNASSQRLRRLNNLENEIKNEINPDAQEEIELLDHREFPYADREIYPKFAVENALAATTKKSRRGMGLNFANPSLVATS